MTPVTTWQLPALLLLVLAVVATAEDSGGAAGFLSASRRGAAETTEEEDASAAAALAEVAALRAQAAEAVEGLTAGESLIVCHGTMVCRSWSYRGSVRTCTGGYYCRAGAMVLVEGPPSEDAPSAEVSAPADLDEEGLQELAALEQEAEQAPVVPPSIYSLWDCRGVRVCRGGYTWHGGVRVCSGGFYCRPY